ncbi:putative uncharacterized protein [Brevibacillus laterosporus GI-9]|uniref:hypothetical protein n=1 Tax=Brevibacillus laterosporus TaxID=1465 RepID=UPI0002405206|nr:hypothetical protein [Brevibacillus laterosporus]CCF16513.1 putative uncharacterized protein [Brevibacillus laterosporus GI-9]
MRINVFSASIIGLIAAVSVIIYFTVWPWVMISLGISSLPNPTKPEITSGEFPFRLVYMINGETKVIEDTLICEYDGIEMDEGHGKYRKWKERLGSGNQKVLLLNADGAPGIAFHSKKTLSQVVYYEPGPAWYYMGDDERGNGYEHGFPNASFSEQYQDGSGANGIIQEDELLKKYNIRLISWDYTQPIKNNF